MVLVVFLQLLDGLHIRLCLLWLTVGNRQLPLSVHLLEPAPQIFHRQLPSIRVLLLSGFQLGPVSPGQIVDLIVQFQLQPIVQFKVMLLVIEICGFCILLICVAHDAAN